jgi:hypothetical protein
MTSLHDHKLRQTPKRSDSMVGFIVIQGVSFIIATGVFGYTVIKGRGKHASKTSNLHDF